MNHDSSPCHCVTNGDIAVFIFDYGMKILKLHGVRGWFPKELDLKAYICPTRSGFGRLLLFYIIPESLH
jgi:hypothetical protein